MRNVASPLGRNGRWFSLVFQFKPSAKDFCSVGGAYTLRKHYVSLKAVD